MFELSENGWSDYGMQLSLNHTGYYVNHNDIFDSTISDKKLFKNAYEKVKKFILKNDEKSAKQIIAVLKKDQRHAINFAPNEEDTLLYLYVFRSIAYGLHPHQFYKFSSIFADLVRMDWPI